MELTNTNSVNTKMDVSDELHYTLMLLRDAIDSINAIHESGTMTTQETKVLHMALSQVVEAETCIGILDIMRVDEIND